jgi:AraC-like DNA-binding protein
MSGAVSMRTIYLRPGIVRKLPRSCCVLNVPILLQELIIHLCTIGRLSRKSKTQAHVMDVLIDQLEIVPTVGLQLPTPKDARAGRVAAMLQRNLGNTSLATMCQHAGASKRTIERIFLQETRMSLGRWRRQLRLLRSLELLAAGDKISYAALEAGYSTPSAFVAMFRKALGTTPRKYFGGNGTAVRT